MAGFVNFLKKINHWGKLPNGLKNSDKTSDKEYNLDHNCYYDHLEPMVMTEEEINNMPAEFERMDEVRNDATVDGKPVSQYMDQLTNRPGTQNITIPGQVVKNPNGTVRVVPMEVPRGYKESVAVSPQGYPQSYPPNYQQPQYAPPPGYTLVPSAGVPVNTGFGAPEPVEKISDNKPTFTLFKVEDAFYLYLDVPGIVKESIKVNIKGDIKLTIEGEFSDLSESVVTSEMTLKNLQKRKKNQILDQKSNNNRSKKFTNVYELSSSVDSTGVKTSLNNGILQLYLPLKEVKETEISVTVL